MKRVSDKNDMEKKRQNVRERACRVMNYEEERGKCERPIDKAEKREREKGW